MLGRSAIKIWVKENTCSRSQPVGVLEHILIQLAATFTLGKKKMSRGYKEKRSFRNVGSRTGGITSVEAVLPI